MITLQNQTLTVDIKEHGAELCSLTNLNNSIEYIWQAKAQWAKHSPILFPIVGQLKYNEYKWQGKTYQMERHGFARNMPFRLIKNDFHAATFELTENAETLKQYPFKFTLQLQYKLNNDTLALTYHIKNNNSHVMPFSIGAHPAFNIPLCTDENYTDYYLEFNEKENCGNWLLENGLLKNELPFFNDSNLIPLSKPLFEKDALVFKNLRSNQIQIKSNKSRHGLQIESHNFPYLGIWAAKNADFVCIEPWHGIADSVNTSGEILEKEGIICLEQNQDFSFTFLIKVF